MVPNQISDPVWEELETFVKLLGGTLSYLPHKLCWAVVLTRHKKIHIIEIPAGSTIELAKIALVHMVGEVRNG